MRRILPAFMGLALALGAMAGVSRADDKYKEKDKAKIENNGDVKVKSKVKNGHAKHKARTKIEQHDDGSLTVKEKGK